MDLVKYLVEEQGAKIGDHAVAGAAESGNLNLVRYLVEEKSAKIGDHAVGDAVRSGKLNIVEYLIKHGAKPSISDINEAIGLEHRDIADYLVEQIAKE